MPIVSFVKIDYKKDLEFSVMKAMELANWKKYVKSGKIFLKINAMGNQLVPGLNTSPFILESVIKILKKEFSACKLYVGDADLATIKQLEYSAKIWGYKRIAEKYNCKFINLSKEETIKKKINGTVFKEIEVPKILEEMDSIISLPVIKTHGLTKMTCALKNSWGFLPRYRHKYHPVAGIAIPEMNRAVKVDFCIVDGTICMEEKGPRTGKPKICDVVLAGNDLVAIDYVVAKFMGIDPEDVTYIKYAEKMKLGSTKDIKIVGDKFFVANFEPPKENLVFFLEKRFRKLPIFKKLLFDTKIFDIISIFVSLYNMKYWYYLKGRKYAKRIFRHPYYGKLYSKLI